MFTFGNAHSFIVVKLKTFQILNCNNPSSCQEATLTHSTPKCFAITPRAETCNNLLIIIINVLICIDPCLSHGQNVKSLMIKDADLLYCYQSHYSIGN